MSTIKSKPLRMLKNLYTVSIAVILFIAFWQVASVTKILDDSIIPPPVKVFSEIINDLKSGELIEHSILSFKRAGTGFLMALVAGAAVGFLLGGLFKRAQQLFLPLLNLLEKLNPFALFPLFMLLFGIGETCKDYIIFWVAVWPILFHTMEGVQGIEPLMIKSAKAMGASRFILFFKVLLPASIPDIFTGIKLGVQYAFFMVISAEIVGGTDGLGYFIWVSQKNYQIIALYAGTIFVAILGLIITKIFTEIEKKLLVWKQNAF